ncbi:hypothetical protein NPIL_403891 [Nephila pilipes]|uniref:Uncharacterized protein n=1 Tax=Nephila pilipes TaxID=299642 RepID=A0A8X6N6D4_NEPPI|nr:hypothetical protein NPIL_403891 [Nephila pilipes]
MAFEIPLRAAEPEVLLEKLERDNRRPCIDRDPPLAWRYFLFSRTITAVDTINKVASFFYVPSNTPLKYLRNKCLIDLKGICIDVMLDELQCSPN